MGKHKQTLNKCHKTNNNVNINNNPYQKLEKHIKKSRHTPNNIKTQEQHNKSINNLRKGPNSYETYQITLKRNKQHQNKLKHIEHLRTG